LKVIRGFPWGDDINPFVDGIVLPILRGCAKALRTSCISIPIQICNYTSETEFNMSLEGYRMIALGR
jgi:hypothetical protein